MIRPIHAWRRLPPILFAAMLASACATQGPMARSPAPDPTPVTTDPGAPASGTEPPVEVAAAPADPAAAATPDGSPAPAEATPAEVPVAAGPAPRATGLEVFDRIRSRLQAPACVDSARARQWQARYAGHPAVFARRLREVLPLLDYVVAEAERASLPGEFVFIPLVESWYSPGAIGRGGPAGMWQMIGTTARNHGVVMRRGYDGRLSPVESTRAAMSYLHALGDMFEGDWQATVMAYNAGEYRVAGALRRSGSRRVSAADGLPAGLSNITYDYVSKLQALSCLVAEPQRANLVLPEDEVFERLAAVPVDARAVSLEHVARRAGLEAAQLRALNPAYRSGLIASGAPRVLLMPLSAAAGVARVDVAGPGPASPVAADTEVAARDPETSATHEVRRGDTLSEIARRYGVTLDALRKLNGLGNRSMIRPGQVLRLVP
jgi:membrane-bound lytic murein transglycosylase D